MSRISSIEYNRVYNMDAVEFIKEVPSGLVDLVITSPPYDNLKEYNGGTSAVNFKKLACELYRVLKNSGFIVWNVNDSRFRSLGLPAGLGVDSVIIGG